MPTLRCIINMIANKTVCKIYQCLTFLLCQFIEAALVTFVAIVFVFFASKLSKAITISSQSVTEVPVKLFRYLLFSQTHVLGFQLYSFSHL